MGVIKEDTRSLDDGSNQVEGLRCGATCQDTMTSTSGF